MTRENWEFDRLPNAPEIIGSGKLTISVSVRGTCDRCGFKKTRKTKKEVGYALYDNGTNAKKFAKVNGINQTGATLKNELAIEHITQNNCREPLVYK